MTEYSWTTFIFLSTEDNVDFYLVLAFITKSQTKECTDDVIDVHPTLDTVTLLWSLLSFVLLLVKLHIFSWL